MKRFLILLLTVGMSIMLASSALAGIRQTRHNLSNNRTSAPTTGNTGTVIYSTTEDQLCVWCHTPHQSNTGVLDAPLWNKSLTSASFSVYGTTIGGTPPATSIATASRICLTCHDGSLAINIVVNAPGPGGVNNPGQPYGQFWGVASGNLIPSTSGAFLGTDLRNDHPISILYSTPSANSEDNPGSLRTTGYVTSNTTSWVPRRGTVAGNRIVDNLVGGNIECVTCHDPHTSANLTFLRATTSGSLVCLTCHDK